MQATQPERSAFINRSERPRTVSHGPAHATRADLAPPRPNTRACVGPASTLIRSPLRRPPRSPPRSSTGTGRRGARSSRHALPHSAPGASRTSPAAHAACLVLAGASLGSGGFCLPWVPWVGAGSGAGNGAIGSKSCSTLRRARATIYIDRFWRRLLASRADMACRQEGTLAVPREAEPVFEWLLGSKRHDGAALAAGPPTHRPRSTRSPSRDQRGGSVR